MSNYVEYKGEFAFHPGRYIEECIEDSGLTQEDFAKRLDTTPKNLSELVNGKQSLSSDMAMKLSRMIGTSFQYWMNLQTSYDSQIAKINSQKELEKEKAVFKDIDYKYFRDYFDLPNIPRKIEEQIVAVRRFLNIATLSVLSNPIFSVKFRHSASDINTANMVKANTMVQIAINKALEEDAPKFNKQKFEKAVKYAVTLTKDHEKFYPAIYNAFLEAGVVFIILPNIKGSKINGATKKIGKSIMLMVNDRRLSADTFWFTLCHEVGHIMHNDLGFSFEKDEGDAEDAANLYAENLLIPKDEYENFINQNRFDPSSIKQFANRINRDPGIVVGRLQNDGYVGFGDYRMKPFKVRYKIKL